MRRALPTTALVELHNQVAVGVEVASATRAETEPGPPWTTSAAWPSGLPLVSQYTRLSSPTSSGPCANGSTGGYRSIARHVGQFVERGGDRMGERPLTRPSRWRYHQGRQLGVSAALGVRSGACLCSRSVEWSRTAELVSLKRLDRGNTERELDRLIEAQAAALGPCRVERVVPQRFSGLGDRRVELSPPD